jgi:high-affinity Fe2+/Pb2+ permease
MEIQYPKYFRVKCYNDNFVRLRLFLYALRNTDKHFWRRCQGMVAVFSSNLVRPHNLSKKQKNIFFLSFCHHEANLIS